jgi:hypothetical protein
MAAARAAPVGLDRAAGLDEARRLAAGEAALRLP